jgi:tRNA(His) 5'-end guanylyltransferase
MNKMDFEQRMRAFETMGKTRVPAGYIVLRLDGKGFSKFTEKHFQKPFDKRFSKMMVDVTTALMEEFGAVYAYTQSDEISLLLPRNFNQYDRELAKLVSLSAAMAASAFTLAMLDERRLREDTPLVVFDSRVWHSDNAEDVVDYFRWRARDAERNSLSTCAYWTLRNSGLSRGAASRMIERQGNKFKLDVLQRNGVQFDKLPGSLRVGVGFYMETYTKDGFNPKTGQTVTVPRRRIKMDTELPVGDAYSAYVRDFVDAA